MKQDGEAESKKKKKWVSSEIWIQCENWIELDVGGSMDGILDNVSLERMDYYWSPKIFSISSIQMRERERVREQRENEKPPDTFRIKDNFLCV